MAEKMVQHVGLVVHLNQEIHQVNSCQARLNQRLRLLHRIRLLEALHPLLLELETARGIVHMRRTCCVASRASLPRCS